MDIAMIKEKCMNWLKKYRFAALILFVGILLMTVPGRMQQNNGDTSVISSTSPVVQKDVTTELTEILSQIQGVGKVRVMLTISAGEKTIYQEDQDVVTGDNSSTVRTETVIITDSNRGQQGLVTQVLPPSYLGAIVVCQGGDLASVKLAVLDAVSKITGLSADKISVLKMK